MHELRGVTTIKSILFIISTIVKFYTQECICFRFCYFLFLTDFFSNYEQKMGKKGHFQKWITFTVFNLKQIFFLKCVLDTILSKVMNMYNQYVYTIFYFCLCFFIYFFEAFFFKPTIKHIHSNPEFELKFKKNSLETV